MSFVFPPDTTWLAGPVPLTFIDSTIVPPPMSRLGERSQPLSTSASWPAPVPGLSLIELQTSTMGLISFRSLFAEKLPKRFVPPL